MHRPLAGSLCVLYEDVEHLVVDKPAGLVVHRGPCADRDTLVARVRRYLGTRTVHPVHRLDRQTSGAVLFAKTPAAARRLRQLFDADLPHKLYLALVRGRGPDFADVDHPIPVRKGGPRVPARTWVRTLAVAEVDPFPVSVVACRPLTGRTHQVRRHMAHLRRPVLMDANYGNSRQNRAFRAAFGLERLGLHAFRLRLPPEADPARGPIVAGAPIPEDLRGVLERLGLDPAGVERALEDADRTLAGAPP